MKKNTGSVHKSLGLASPWEILEDQYDEKEKVRRVMVTCTDASSLACPECNQVCPFYDLRTLRSWRHLDIWCLHGNPECTLFRINKSAIAPVRYGFV